MSEAQEMLAYRKEQTLVGLSGDIRKITARFYRKVAKLGYEIKPQRLSQDTSDKSD